MLFKAVWEIWDVMLNAVTLYLDVILYLSREGIYDLLRVRNNLSVLSHLAFR